MALDADRIAWQAVKHINHLVERMQQAAGRALHLGQELGDFSAKNRHLEAQNEELSKKVAELEQQVH